MPVSGRVIPDRWSMPSAPSRREACGPIIFYMLYAKLVRIRCWTTSSPSRTIRWSGSRLDILSSDYVPASLLHAAVLLHTQLGWPLPPAIATVTATPAERVGLDDRGDIVPGRRADLVRVRVVDGLPVVRAVWRLGERVA